MRTFTLRHHRWWVARAFGRNPLLRRIDRIEAAVIVAGFVVALVVTAVCVFAGAGVYRSHAQLYAAQSSARHAVSASVIETGPQLHPPHVSTMMVHAMWVVGAGDGRRGGSPVVRTAWVSTNRALKNGDPVDIWVNDQGEPVAAPTPPSQAAYDAVGVSAVIWCFATLGVAAVVGLIRATLNRIRGLKWDREMKTFADGGRSNHLF